MKKLFGLFALFLVVGAGCLGAGPKTNGTEGDWALAFDLPEGWVMVMPYKDVINLAADIERTDSEVYLQSTDKTIVFFPEGVEDQEAFLKDRGLSTEIVESDSFIKISITRLDARRVIPGEAVDIGNSLKKIEEPCVNSVSQTCGQYYLEKDGNKYRFDVFATGRELSEAEAVMFTAKTVTETEGE